MSYNVIKSELAQWRFVLLTRRQLDSEECIMYFGITNKCGGDRFHVDEHFVMILSIQLQFLQNLPSKCLPSRNEIVPSYKTNTNPYQVTFKQLDMVSCWESIYVNKSCNYSLEREYILHFCGIASTTFCNHASALMQEDTTTRSVSEEMIVTPRVVMLGDILSQYFCVLCQPHPCAFCSVQGW